MSMCAFLEERGLRCIEVVDVMRRPGDGALWQFDLFLVPKDRAEFASSTYRSVRYQVGSSPSSRRASTPRG